MDATPLHLQTECLHHEFYNNYAFDVVLVDGAMFLKASLHGLNEKICPMCKHHALMIGLLERLHDGKECPLTAQRCLKQIRRA